jgi:ABC-type multidrug transport system ATPase subunit
MFEAESLADRVGIMDHGHLLPLDIPAGLMRSLPGSSTLEVVVDPSRLRWFQVITTLNPMTYVRETMRASLVPGVAHT